MFWRKRTANDFAEEIKAHLELEADELRSEGLGEEDARWQAMRNFGNVTSAQERFYLYKRWVGLDKLVRDFTHGIRSLGKNPGFAAVAILTLALGVGANTAVFSVMNAVLLARLPVKNANRLVYLRTSNTPRGTGTIDSHQTFSWAVYDALRRQSRGLAAVMAYVPLSASKVAVRTGAEPEQAEGDMVSGTFFSGLGVKLIRGHGFAEKDEADHSAVAVLSYDYWTRRFARRPEVLGKTLHVNGVAFTIIGIAAPGFEGLEPGRSTDFWVPLQNRPELNAWGNPLENGKTYLDNPTWWCLRLIGRLSPGFNKARAVAQLQPVFQQAAYLGLGSPMPGEKRPTLSLVAARGLRGYAGIYGRPLWLMMGMVSLVLLIAVTNVVMLLMARNATRRREFSVRLALGAGRVDLLRQLLVEGLLLASAGGGLAWSFAVLATHSLARWAHIESSLAPDRTVLLFTMGILALAALVCGLAPLRIALSAGSELTSKSFSSATGNGSGRSRAGRMMVAFQMTLCVVLLVSAALLVRTLRNLENTPLGFRVHGLVVFGVNPDIHSLAQGRQFYLDLISRLRALPGVESVTIMEERLGSGWSDNGDMRVDGKLPDVPNGASRMVRSNIAGPGYFTTLGVPILAGRDFADSDTASSPHVGIINEEFAQRFLPGQNPLGHIIGTGNGRYQMTVVGVVKDHKYRSITERPIPMAWYMYAQIPIIGAMNVELRVEGDPLAILPAARRVVQQMDPNLPLIRPMTQRAQYDLSISSNILFARLAGFFGVLAVLLAAGGLYGTLAYRVNMRTAEIGVRMALGARRAQVVWMILRDSLLLTLLGVAAGVPLAMAAGRVLTAQLYGVKPLDALSYGFAVALVAGVALAASAVPARQAAGVDPSIALRAE